MASKGRVFLAAVVALAVSLRAACALEFHDITHDITRDIAKARRTPALARALAAGRADWRSVAAHGPTLVWFAVNIKDGGYVVSTTDGGKKWRAEEVGKSAKWFSICALGEEPVWLAGSARVGGGSKPVIWRTDDRGEWPQQPEYADPHEGLCFRSINFTGHQRGAAVGARNSVEQRTLAVHTKALRKKGNDTKDKDRKGGKHHWKQIILPPHDGGFYDVAYRPWAWTWIVGDNGTVFKRWRPTVAATRWIQVGLPGRYKGPLYAVAALGRGRAIYSVWIARGDGKVVRRPPIRRASFLPPVRVTAGTALYDVCFQDHSHGWVCGAGGALSETTDGGKTWTPCAHPWGKTNKTLWGLAVVPGQRVYVCGEAGAAVADEGVPAPPKLDTD